MTLSPMVYLADDNEDHCFILAQIFKLYLPTYQTQFFADGRQLIDALAQDHVRPSLLLIDYHMPGLDGPHTLVHVRAHPCPW